MLRRLFDFVTVGRRGRGRPKIMWRGQVEEHINQTRPKKESAIDKTKWSNDVYELSRNTRIWPLLLTMASPDFKIGSLY